ncbi:MAG: hypothetical protein R3A52_23240 [Polyangiales bacterium]
MVEAFREFKLIWDPDGKMNPGKVVDAYTPTENLRLGSDYRPARRSTRTSATPTTAAAHARRTAAWAWASADATTAA